jgi:hypothetical protein
VIHETPVKLPEPDEKAKLSGRRSVLADWMTSPSNPLTARVFVNRLWQHHFGRGIVATSNDFGQFGDRPSHPELLDWLANDFAQVDLYVIHISDVVQARFQGDGSGSVEPAFMEISDPSADG